MLKMQISRQESLEFRYLDFEIETKDFKHLWLESWVGSKDEEASKGRGEAEDERDRDHLKT
jgi:hypothetical protein